MTKYSSSVLSGFASKPQIGVSSYIMIIATLVAFPKTDPPTRSMDSGASRCCRAPWRISQQLAESPYSWIFGGDGVPPTYMKNSDFRENPGKEIFFWSASQAVPVISFGFWGVPVLY